MRAGLIFVAALSAAVAFGQDISRVFQLHHIDREQDIQEFATMARTVAALPSLTADPAQKTISANGTAAQIAIAEWLFTELDRQTLPDFATKEFKVPNKEDDVVRIFFVRNTATIQEFQEVATAVRTLAEIRRVFTFNTPRALAVRGTADQIAATEWMIRELDQPAGAKRADSRDYQMIDTSKHPETEVRVYYVPYAATIQQFQEVATLARTVVEIRRVFTYNTPRAVLVRGTPDQVAAVGWLIHELAKPVSPNTVASEEHRMIDLNHRGEEVMRVFYVNDVTSVAALQQVATQIRSTAQTRLLFAYAEMKAIALRGTAEQLAMVDQILKDRALQIAAK